MAAAVPSEPAPATTVQEQAASKIPEKYSLKILPVSRTMQMQHGLRHNDHQRYRRYTAGRVRAIRHMLQFQQMDKKRFSKKALTPAVAAHPAFLELGLMLSERAWAYAMELKESIEEARKRFHYRRKLAKAVKLAEQLQAVCSAKGDSRTVLEAEAYAAGMSGLLLQEESEFAEGLKRFTRAKTIYEEMAKVAHIDEQRQYQGRVEELDISIRYCNHNLGSAVTVETHKATAPDELRSKIDDALAEARQSQGNSMREISWRGRVVGVKNEKVSLAFLAARDAAFELEKADGARKMEAYDKLFVHYNDAIRFVKDDLAEVARQSQAAKKGKPDAPVKKMSAKAMETEATLTFLNRYVSFLKVTRTIERNVLMTDAAEARFEGKAQGEGKPPKPEDLAKLYENLIQNTADLDTLREKEDAEGGKEILARSLTFKAFRNKALFSCFYTALSYAGASKWNEAAALLERAAEEVVTARQHQQACASVRQGDLQRLAALENRVKGEKSLLTAKACLAASKSTASVTAAAPVVATPATTSGRSAADNSALQRRPNEYDASTADTRQVADFPPSFQPISCKPLFFDLTIDTIEFPDLESRAQSKKGGLLGFLRR